MKHAIVIGLAVVACVSCKGKKASSAGAAELPPELATWMPSGVSEALQGAWAGRLTFRTGGTISLAGDPAAIEIKGDKATAWDGAADHVVEVVVAAPCSISFRETSSVGGGTMTSSHDIQFLLDKGKLALGEGAVGLRKGKSAVVCAIGLDNLMTLDDKGTCLSWKLSLGAWQHTPTTCSWGTKNGKDVLTVGTDEHWKSELVADGDVLKTDQFGDWIRDGYWRKVADLSAAKKLVGYSIQDKDEAKNVDPKPGAAGDLTTIRNIQASYVADNKSIVAKPVEITGYLEAIHMTDKGFMILTLVDQPGFAKPAIDCVMKTPIEVSAWDKLVVKGTLTESFSRAEVADCSATKAP